VKSDSRLSFEVSHEACDGHSRRYLHLKVNVIWHEVTLQFFYFEFFEKIGDNSSELFFEFSIDDFLPKLWTKYYVIRTIPLDVSSMGIFLNIGVHGLKKGYDVSSRGFLQSLEYHNLFSFQ